MARGERIGDAFVRIHAETGPYFSEGIRKDLDKAGQSGGQAFAEGFEKGFNDEFDDAAFSDAFDNAIGRMSGRLERLDIVRDDIRDKVESAFSGELGARMADNLVADLEEGFRDFDSGSLFGDLEAQSRKAAEQMVADFDSSWDEAIKLNNARNQKILQDNEETAKAERKLLADVSDFRNRMWQQRVREEEEAAKAERRLLADVSAFRNRIWQQRLREDAEAKKSLGELEAMLARLVSGNQKYGDSIGKVNRQTRELRVTVDALGDALGKNKEEIAETDRQFRLIRASTITLTPRINRLNRQWRDLSDTMGRFSGRGSRNNFLNFVGSVNRNFSNLVGTVVLGSARMVVGLVNFARAIPEALTDPKLLGQMAVNFGAAIANIIPTLIAIGVTFLAVSTAAGILAAALSGLVGILLSLTATVAFAAAGIAPLVGLLTPLAVNVGIAVAAFKSLDDAQKEALKTDLKPLTDQFKELGDIAADVLFRDIGKWAKQLAPQLGVLEEGVHRIASAMRDSIGAAVDEASKEGSGFEQFLDRLTTKTENHRAFLATSTRKLGDIFTDVIGGLGGLFIAMIPAMNRLLGFLGDITERFSEWANSRRGRDEIRDFFEKVGDSAEALGGFLDSAVRLVGKLLDKSRSTGDSIFDDMSNAIEDMIEWLDSPEGQKAMDDWLQFAKDLSEDLGDALVAAKDLFDELDDEDTRKALRLTLDIIIAITEALTNAVAWAEDFGEDIGRGVAKITGAFNGLEGLSWSDPFTKPLETIERLMTFLRRLSSGIASLPIVGNLFQTLADGIAEVDELIDDVARGIRKLPTVDDLFAQAYLKAKQFKDFVSDSVTSAINRLPSVANLFSAVTRAVESFLDLLRKIPNLINNLPTVGSLFAPAIGAATMLMTAIDNVKDALTGGFSFNIDWPEPPGWLDKITASGGVFAGAQTRIIGEAGPEAVVPLNRPLNLVDPSVRWLSAIAQGKSTAPGAGGAGTGGRSVVVPSINVYPQATDAGAVAQETLNRIVALSY